MLLSFLKFFKEHVTNLSKNKQKNQQFKPFSFENKEYDISSRQPKPNYQSPWKNQDLKRGGGPFCRCCSSEALFLRPISFHTSHLERCSVLSGGERDDRKCYKGRTQYLERRIYLLACRIKVRKSPQQRTEIKAGRRELGDIFNILWYLPLPVLLPQQHALCRKRKSFDID